MRQSKPTLRVSSASSFYALWLALEEANLIDRCFVLVRQQHLRGGKMPDKIPIGPFVQLQSEKPARVLHSEELALGKMPQTSYFYRSEQQLPFE